MMVSRSDAETVASQKFAHGKSYDAEAWERVVQNTHKMLLKDAGEFVEAIGTERFKVPSAQWPFCNVWFEVDYIDDGKIVLKQSENQS